MRLKCCFNLSIIPFMIITLQLNVQTFAKILRNPALISKMMSDFHKDKTPRTEQKGQNYEKRSKSDDITNYDKEQTKIANILESVLCNNFPTIPCYLITEDPMLKKLIERSVQQINFKKLTVNAKPTSPQYPLTLFPTVNSEELSNFVQVRHPSYSTRRRLVREEKQPQNTLEIRKTAKKYRIKERNVKFDNRIYEKAKEKVRDTRKTLRKYYPHKNKYKDKVIKNNREHFSEYTDEKLSMSVEIPEVNVLRTNKNSQFSFKLEQNEEPIWKIEYMKHSGPDYNIFGSQFHDNRLKGKIMKTGPNVIVDDGAMEHNMRKDVLHSDVYIKKNLGRKLSLDLNSEGNDRDQ